MKAARLAKISACLCFALLAVAVLAARNSPATGYEPSIYRATPSIIWYCLFISIACGIGIVVHQASRQREGENLWIMGWGLILLSNGIVLSLHILRGYFLWCASGDPGTHLGFAQDLIASGHLGETVHYPITHVFLAQLHMVSSLDLIIWFKWVPGYFALAYMVGMYYVAKTVFPHKGQVMLAALAATPLISGWFLNVTPNGLANMFTPLALYLLVRSYTSGTVPWKILFLIMVFLYPPFHPLPAVSLLLIVWTIALPAQLFPSLRGETHESSHHRFRFNVAVSALLLVFTITWVSSFYIWGSFLVNLKLLIAEGGPSPLAGIGPGLQEAAKYGYSATEQFLRHYFGIVVYILLGLAGFALLLRTPDKAKYARLLGMYGPLLVFGLIVATSILAPTTGDVGRLMFQAVMMCTVVTGLPLFEAVRTRAVNGDWHRGARAVLVSILLLAVSAGGILKIYPSPYVLSPSWQTTQAEVNGMDFLLHSRDGRTAISSWDVAAGRFAAFLMTEEQRRRTPVVPFSPGRGKYGLSNHFGYDRYALVGQSYSENMYVVFGERLRTTYTETLPEIAFRTLQPDDFVRLEHDPSIDRLYVNGGFDVWIVHAMRSS